jgi:autotransporter-associated beta strand protein
MHRTNRNTRSILAAAITLTALASAARATDGTWTAGGANTSWSNTDNWFSGTVADGTDANATFSLDLTASKTATVDSARTVGNLFFSDLDPSTPANWVVNSPGPLTLAVSAGTPTITANSLFTDPITPANNSFVQLNVPLAGTQGIQIAGSSPVFFNGNNTFTGGLTIPAGSTVLAGAALVPGNTAASSISASDAVAVNGSLLLRASTGTNNVIYSLSGSGIIGTDPGATSGSYLSFRVKQGSFSGNISDAPNGPATGGAHIGLLFDSTAPGLIDLSGTNTYTGDTLVRTGGVLRLSSDGALPTNSFLRLQPGANTTATLVLNAGDDFVRLLGGTTSTGSGGTIIGSNNTNNVVNFGNIGQDRKITFTDSSNNPVTLKWSNVSTDLFTPSVLGLGTTDSTNTINFTNPMDFNGLARTININNGSAAIDAEISGTLSNSSATAATLGFNGTGTLLLSGNNSAFTSAVTINTPAVRLASSSSLGTNTTIAGGTTTTGRVELTDGQNISSPISIGGRSGAASLAPALSGASGDSTYSGTLTTAGGGNLYNISADAGTLTIAGTINNAAGTNRFLQFMGANQGFVTSSIGSSLNVSKFGNGTWTLSGANTYAGATSVSVGTLVLASSQINTASITVADGASLKVTPGANKTIKTTTITTTGSGTFDLADNKLALTSVSVTTDTLRSLLSTGYSGGSWTGPGITSSSAANDPNHITAIGYASASDLGVSTWGSASVAAANIVAKYTYTGDANLDGKINADDYALLDRGFAQSQSGTLTDPHWINGDFNYDGVVDSNDYLLLDTTYLTLNPSAAPTILAQRDSQFGDAYVSTLLTSIPEPTSLTACLFAGYLFSRRRQTPISK